MQIQYWQRTPDTITAHWDPVPGLMVAMGYSGAVPDLQASTSTHASIPFAGMGMVELRLQAPGKEMETFYCSISGEPPVRPFSVMYRDLSEAGMVITWGSPTYLGGTSFWMVSGDINGIETVLAMVPAAGNSAPVVIPEQRISKIRVYGVDGRGVRSEASPDLAFNGMSGGPSIKLGSFAITSSTASISWQVGSYDVIKKISYKLTGSSSEDVKASGEALPIDSIKVQMANYVGPLTFTMEAHDMLGRNSIEHRSIYVYNQPPEKPGIIIEEVGLEFIRVRVVPDPDSVVPTEKIILNGANRQETLYSPYVMEFNQLRQGTSYAFNAIAVNPTGLRSAPSETVYGTTMRLPLPDSNTISTEYSGGPVLPYLHSLLLPDVRHFVLQLYTDTRVRDFYREQIIDTPFGFNAAMEFMMKVGEQFGAAIRAETQDEESFRASLTIDKTADVLEKLAIYCERIEYGSVWNPG